MTETNTEFDEDLMERMATLAQSAYTPTKQKRQRDVDARFNGEYRLVDNYSNKFHSVYLDKNDDLFIAVRGTDVNNKFGQRITDLGNDVLVTLGLEQLGGRYKKADRLVSQLKREFPDQKITLTGHSLAGSIVNELSFKHDLESHAFAAGATPMSLSVKKHKVLHPENKRKKKQNHHYVVMPSFKGTGVDPISISNILNPLANVHLIEPKKISKKEEGVLFHHSSSHFMGKSAVM